ncbi:ATP-NAD kinase [Candidatus Bathyarchaeota archaeon]|nr:MAG: ATP-NAD kinase [Candidatus Bathyarchaeota archaeon]
MKTLGLIVNPIAGMGGAVGLKGTDGKRILEKAIVLGAKPIAPARAELFLSRLKPFKDKIAILAAAGNMGEYEANNVSFKCTIVGEAKAETTPEDTRRATKELMKRGVDLLVFCGGDGTARDVMDAVGNKIPVVGVPTGVKMHSAVFAVNPESAARIATRFLLDNLPLKEAEVMDVDEEAFRQGRLSAKLYGFMLVPYEPRLLQTTKIASPITEDELRNQAAIAVYLTEEVLKPDVIYILGPGTTTRTITDLLDQKKTLLGVDLLRNGKIIAHDANEKQILRLIEGKDAKIIVTPIGGQGFIFGRGNQQISPAVIRKVGKDNIIVISTKSKLRQIRKLKVDTGSPELDRELRGHIRVITDYREEHVVPVE